MKTVGYIRVSTEEQADSGLSLKHQRSKIVAYAHAADLELLEIFEDAGKSAKDLKRPGIQAALREVGEGRARALVVLKLDRLTRSVKDLGHLVEFFDKTKAVLISVHDSINTSTAGGRLVLNVLGSIAQWEREAIGERTAAALAVKVAQGEKIGGTVPYGFDVDETGKLLPNPKEQEALALIRRWGKTRIPLREIGRRLLTRGFPPKVSPTWHPQVIKQILAGCSGK